MGRTGSFCSLQDDVVPPAQRPTDSQPQDASVGADELRVAGSRAVVAEEAVRTLDHLTGPDVVAALVPRADQAAVGVHPALGEVGELVAATPGDGEVPAVPVADGPVADAADRSRRQVGGGDPVGLGHASSTVSGPLPTRERTAQTARPG